MRSDKAWFVYLVECADNALYCGVTTDVDNRLSVHNLGKGAKYTRSRTPVKLVAASCALSRSEALRLEYRIKRMPSGRKRAGLDCKKT